MSDREKIQNHLAKYCFVVDRASAEEIADLFWDDAELEFGGRYEGKVEILQCFSDWIVTMRDPVEGLRHLIHIPYIEIDGTEARSECYADADAHTKRSGRCIRNRAVYRDVLTCRDGEWRFASRKIIWMRALDESLKPLKERSDFDAGDNA